MAGTAEQPIAIVTPMRCELAPFVERLGLREIEAASPWAVFGGRCGAGAVVAAVSGCGMVNCAAATARLLAQHRPRVALHSRQWAWSGPRPILPRS